MMQQQTTSDRDRFNVAGLLGAMARARPHKRAVVCPAGRDAGGRVRYSQLTFEQLEQECDRLACGLVEAGVVRGSRTVVMVKPQLEFFALVFALFKVGAVPVVVDPGMGVRRMVRCLEQSRPTAFIGIPPAHVIRLFLPRYFKTVKNIITVGRRWFWTGPTLSQLRARPWRPFAEAATTRNEPAAVLFTTGSTGPAKGVVYTHGIFGAQIAHIQSHFQIAADEIDLPTFPLFALFDPALGMTAVIPEMDPTRPAHVDPARICEAIFNQGVTNMFASPALLDRVGRWSQERNVKLPSLRRVVCAGAPVAPANIERFAGLLTEEAQIHTPYGATEAVPVLSIGSREILGETRQLSEQGFGICVGRPIDNLMVRLIGITDDPIAQWSESLTVADGETGEIAVKGDLVTRRYFRHPEADAMAKIADGDEIWHRMGDIGWRDQKGRIWFCGRKSHRVITATGTLFTIPCEAIFNNHPAVLRSALVGVGTPPSQKPVICIELQPEHAPADRELVREELLALAGTTPLTRGIDTILFCRRFPVDIRHNAKIFREKLARWAAGRLGEESAA